MVLCYNNYGEFLAKEENKMLRIAVCDDEEFVCSALESYIISSCDFLHIVVEIDLFSSGSGLKKYLKEGNVYNILFLDIELQDDTGISISDCIRNELNDQSTQIVYVSGKNEYDRQLFAFRPFAFIEKPFDESVILTTIEKYMRIYGERNTLFHYKYGHDTYWVDINSILYFKSNRRKIKIITLTGEDEFYDSLRNIIDQLSEMGFFSPHKSYLVNYRYIRSFQAENIVMVNGSQIPIAKGKRDEISKLQLHFENGGRMNEPKYI